MKTAALKRKDREDERARWERGAGSAAVPQGQTAARDKEVVELSDVKSAHNEGAMSRAPRRKRLPVAFLQMYSDNGEIIPLPLDTPPPEGTNSMRERERAKKKQEVRNTAGPSDLVILPRLPGAPMPPVPELGRPRRERRAPKTANDDTAMLEALVRKAKEGAAKEKGVGDKGKNKCMADDGQGGGKTKRQTKKVMGEPEQHRRPGNVEREDSAAVDTMFFRVHDCGIRRLAYLNRKLIPYTMVLWCSGIVSLSLTSLLFGKRPGSSPIWDNRCGAAGTQERKGAEEVLRTRGGGEGTCMNVRGGCGACVAAAGAAGGGNRGRRGAGGGRKGAARAVRAVGRNRGRVRRTGGVDAKWGHRSRGEIAPHDVPMLRGWWAGPKERRGKSRVQRRRMIYIYIRGCGRWKGGAKEQEAKGVVGGKREVRASRRRKVPKMVVGAHAAARQRPDVGNGGATPPLMWQRA
ncbi:hypothetical protein B0H17DRAFT_1137792 [Mycena rosella]|uniref:Uncharacterized protein n=1 Tax=Mycena rosella TaxID=1033263 RepID=A0AAD7GEC4_MYCRO|nr:hypothetical protein B0H17DRAFT_1137792 [Mycena rosella]